jgi:hypothetical protein
MEAATDSTALALVRPFRSPTDIEPISVDEQRKTLIST